MAIREDSKEASNIRKLHGAEYTPLEVANPLTKIALSKLNSLKPNILEPSVGDGFFISAIETHLKGEKKITAIDINPNTTKSLRNFFSDKHINIENFDFLSFFLKNTAPRFDLVIGNPPFIRKHIFSEDFKKRISEICRVTGYKDRNIKNSWAAFTVLSTLLLNTEGCLAFILPYELLTVNYGKEVQNFLKSHFERIDIYIPREKAFKQLDQDAVALIAQKKTKEAHGFFLHNVQSLEKLEPIQTGRHDDSSTNQNIVRSASFLLPPETISLLEKISASTPIIGDYCKTSPGIVTAANDYFIVTHEEAERLHLTEFALPILRKGAYLPNTPIFSSADFDNIRSAGKPCYFLNLRNDLLSTDHGNIEKYLEEGIKQNIHLRYKCRHRKVWFEVPYVAPGDGFFFKRSHKIPRLLVNEAKILTTDSAYQIRCNNNVKISDICFSYYNSLSLLFSELYGRFYGGGVLELTPSEFRKIPILMTSPTNSDLHDFLSIHNTMGSKAFKGIESFGDKWLSKKANLQPEDIARLSSALTTVRKHRLRHGNG